MLEKLGSVVADNLIQANIIDQEDKDIYEYGIDMAVTYSINLLTILAVGIFTGQLWECLLFILVFIPLRSYAGGYHASSEKRCYFLSVALIVLALTALQYKPIWMNAGINLLYLLSSCIIIFVLAPVENKSKPLDSDEVRVYGRRARLILLAEAAAALVCCFFAWDTVYRVFVLGTVSVGCSLIAGVFANRNTFFTDCTQIHP